jgi:hypothetical protein
MTRRIAAMSIPLQPDTGADGGPGPASLTQVPSHAAERCPICSGSRLTRIAMVLTDGSPVDFTSCHTCEHRSWVQHGSPLPIDAVLDKTRKIR